MAKKKTVSEQKKKKGLAEFYAMNYKKFLVFPILLFVFSLVMIFIAIANDGTPMYRDVSLKGGLSAVIEIDSQIDAGTLENRLEENFEGNTFVVSELYDNNQVSGFIIDTDLDDESLLNGLNEIFSGQIVQGENYNSNFISPTLSNAFFKQAILILIISFVLMSTVVFLYFRETVPSLAVIISAIFDIIVTIGILNFLGLKVSVAGIGALIMLIGYSIDTDVLLTNRLIKEKKDESYFAKTFEAFKTGSLMSVTTLIAAIGAIILTNSSVISEIATILVIGLIVDYISTWIQNTAILLWWLEKRD